LSTSTYSKDKNKNTMSVDDDPVPSPCRVDDDKDSKRRKISHDNNNINEISNSNSNSKEDVGGHIVVQYLGVGGTASEPPPALQSLLPIGQTIRQDLYKLQAIFDAAKFRTSIVQSPRLAVSVYKDSCSHLAVGRNNEVLQQQQDYLLTMLGLHPEQEAREAYYMNHMREQCCLHQFLARLRFACRPAMKDSRVQEWVDQFSRITTTERATPLTALDFQALIKLLLHADHKLRQEQLDHELDRIRWYNCTLANALLQQFIHKYHSCIIKDVFFKTSQVAKFERITFYLYDADIDMGGKPTTNFIFLPDLSRALQLQANQPGQQQQALPGGTQAIVQDMMATFWGHLLRHGGYYASTTMKEQLTPALERYFLSGLHQDTNIPLKL